MRVPDIRPPGAVRPDDPESCHDGNDADCIRRDVSGDRRGAVRNGITRLDGLVPPAGSPDESSGSLPGGREHASGPRRADGGAVGPTGGGERPQGLRFDAQVASGGYAWWYVDAISDNGA